MAKLEIKNWYILNGKLYGDVFNHPRFTDGAPLNGSDIRRQYQDPADDSIIHVLTRNTHYTLLQEDERKLANGKI
jgi:hypothetical protein